MIESDFQTFEAVGALVVVLDADDRIIYWNQACSNLTGYALDEVRGRRFWDFLLIPEEVEPVRLAVRELRVTERPRTFANYWVTRTGARRWIAWSHTVTKGADESSRYFVKTGIDRTESKQAEDELAGVIGIAADAIISIDDQHRIVIYNQGAETIFGWSAAEVMGKPLDVLLPERFRHPHDRHLDDFATGDVTARHMGQRSSIIFGLRKDGTEFPAQAAISKVDVGSSRLFTVVLRDVSEQTRREQERDLQAELGASLAETLDYDDTLMRFARLVVRDLADFCVVDLVGKDGTLRRTKVLHRDPDKTAACHLFLGPFPDGQLARVVSAVVQSHRPCLMVEVPQLDPEASARDAPELHALREGAPRSLMVVPLLARGRLLGTLTIVSSHPTRRYEERDLRLAEDLGRRAALALENASLYDEARRATRDLREANEQMVSATIRAQELTDEADAARSRIEESERELREVGEFRELFIGIVSHDLRNPLASIRMATNLLLQRGELDPHTEKQVGLIVRSSQRMTRMISQLLDLTRARLGGGFPLQPKPTDLGEVCRTVVEELAAAIHLEVEGDLTGVWDPDRLSEALSNIAGNAVEHATPGTVVVVKARAEAADVVVEISNQGEPIPGNLLPFIFEPFRRAKQHTVSATGNLGLGLYIAKQIVSSGCGTLVAHSGDGTTTFSMRLPRQQPAAAKSQSDAASVPPPATT